MLKTGRLPLLLVFIALLFPGFASSGERTPGRVDDLNRAAEKLLSGEELLSGDLKQAIELNQAARQLAEELNYQQGLGRALLIQTRILLREKKFLEAEETCRRALGIFVRLNDNSAVCDAHFRLAFMFDLQGQYDLAIKHYMKTLETADPEVNREKMLASYLNLGILFRRTRNHRQSQFFIEQGRELAQKAGDKYFQGLFAQQNGLDALDNPAVALRHYESAASFYESCGRFDLAKQIKSNMASLQLTLGQPERALALLTEIEDFIVAQNNFYTMTYFFINYARAQAALQRPAAAERCFNQALAAAEQSAPNEEIAVLAAYSEFLYQQGEYKRSFDLYKKMVSLQEELVNLEKQKAISELQEQYQAESRAREIEVLKKDRRIARLARQWLIALLLLILLVLGLVLKKYFEFFAFWRKERQVGQYRLAEILGSGGIGVVYKGYSLRDKKKTVAVKLLKEEAGIDTASVKRFQREGAIVDRLQHPHIVRVLERGEQDGRFYLVMEYLPGRTLDQLIRERGRLPLATCLEILHQACSALAHIHQKGVIHCDLKPQNIMILEPEQNPVYVKLLDFGLSKVFHHSRLTTVGVVMGTFPYLAPEVFLNQGQSFASDVYSLGIIGYQMLCGRLPFEDDSLTVLVSRIIRDEPHSIALTRPEIPSELEELLAKMIDKNPQNRPDIEAGLRILSNICQEKVISATCT